jgi:hypothetical protein
MNLSRLIRRLFYCLISIPLSVSLTHALPPATTVVSGNVYRADGTPAAGTLVISWPAFTSADNQAVAAGTFSISIGTGGAISVALVPNINATPAGTFYRVIYKLDDGSTSTEYWVIPTSSPTTIAAVRSTVVPASVAVQFASKQYVDAGLATKANDTAVVHLTGNESVAGVKTFSSSPLVPTPATDTAAANKSYVDSVAVGWRRNGFR